ncbi:DoxX family protein [Congregibacter variabilis]|uniref:DoxX family protein n=1 Tax=Congregibacter variabilis TaxID=3081200 RepID=A0ABZ0I1D9_9GAMM|nr:DoxX family protein [Congregibacter sp. IMCC43200]
MNNTIQIAQRAMLLAGRILLGLYFILPGITKITGFDSMVQYMSAHGVPFVQPLLILTIILQLFCGASLAAGWRTQLMAFVLAGLTLVISIYMHDFWSMEEGLQRAHEMQNFIKNMAIMAGLLFVAGVTPARKA